MPYLADHDNRQAIEDAVANMQVDKMNGAELNFTLCTILNQFIAGKDSLHTFSYGKIQEATGAYHLAFLEWHRKVVAPYEDYKAVINGDLPWPE